MALALALASMGCAAGNDLVGKRRMAGAASPARHLTVAALVWVAVFAGPAIAAGAPSAATLRWGALSGIAGIAANLLLLRAMRRGSAGACSTIYRLNAVPATLLATVMLGERLGPLPLAALAAGTGAAVLLAGERRALDRASLGFAVAACLLRALMSVGYRLGQDAGAPVAQLLLINGVAWLIGARLAAIGDRAAAPWRAADVGFGLASGGLLCGNVLCLALALADDTVARVVPVSQLGFVVTTIAGAAWFREPITARVCASVALGVGCVVMLAAA